MTVICAMSLDGETWIGADRRTTFGNYIHYDDAEKWLIIEGRAIGFSGHSRMKQLIITHKVDLTGHPYDVCESLKKIVNEDGWKIDAKDGDPQRFEIEGLIVNERGIWRIDSGFSAHPIPLGSFVAVGSGEECALGAAYAVMQGEHTARKVVRTAILAACAVNRGCGGTPFVYQMK